MENRILKGPLTWELKEPFFLASGDAFIFANAYPENIKAIGSIGRTNL
jgi:hypothetical protein